MLVKITLERSNWWEFSWPGKILLFLNIHSFGATSLGTEGMEIWEKFIPRESILHWESVRGKIDYEFWTRGETGGVERLELIRN